MKSEPCSLGHMLT